MREGGGARGSAMAKPAWMVQKERADTVAADAKAARLAELQGSISDALQTVGKTL